VVETDEGISGYGEAKGTPVAMKGLIEQHLKSLLVGEDPTRVTYLWEKMFNGSRVGLALYYGRSMAVPEAPGNLMCAISDETGFAEANMQADCTAAYAAERGLPGVSHSRSGRPRAHAMLAEHPCPPDARPTVRCRADRLGESIRPGRFQTVETASLDQCELV